MSSSLNDSQQADAIAALAADVSASTSELLADVKKLSQGALETEQSFANLSSVFQRAIGHLDESDAKENLAALGTTWDTHRETYTKLLWTSRERADTVEGVVNDFASNVCDALVDPEVSAEDRKDLLTDYQSTLAKNGANSQDVAEGLDELVQDVASFISDWTDFVRREDIRLNAEQSEAVQKLAKKVDQCQDNFDEASKKIGSLAESVGILYAVSGKSGVTSVLSSASPVAWPTLLAKRIRLATSEDLVDELNSDFEAAKKKLDQAQMQRQDYKLQHITALDELNAGLLNTQSDLRIVSTSISGLISAYGPLQVDVQQLLQFSKEGMDRSLFNLNLKGVAALYTATNSTLKQYQVAVVLPKRK